MSNAPADASPPSTTKSCPTSVPQTLFPVEAADPLSPSIRRSWPIESPLMTMPAGFSATRSCWMVTVGSISVPPGSTVRSWVTVVPEVSTQVAPLGTVTFLPVPR